VHPVVDQMARGVQLGASGMSSHADSSLRLDGHATFDMHVRAGRWVSVVIMRRVSHFHNHSGLESAQHSLDTLGTTRCHAGLMRYIRLGDTAQAMIPERGETLSAAPAASCTRPTPPRGRLRCLVKASMSSVSVSDDIFSGRGSSQPAVLVVGVCNAVHVVLPISSA
jgi:hypothetical protein